MFSFYLQTLHLILYDGNLKVDHEGGNVYVNGQLVTGLIPGEPVMEGNCEFTFIQESGRGDIAEFIDN